MRMEEIFQGKVTQDKNHRKRYIGIYPRCIGVTDTFS